MVKFLPTNMVVLSASLKGPECRGDRYYKKSILVITGDKSETNDLISANNDILQSITAYKIASEEGEQQTCTKIVQRIMDRLKQPGINYSEFTSYWATLDTSYSIYIKLKQEDKEAFVKDAIEQYIRNAPTLKAPIFI